MSDETMPVEVRAAADHVLKTHAEPLAYLAGALPSRQHFGLLLNALVDEARESGGLDTSAPDDELAALHAHLDALYAALSAAQRDTERLDWLERSDADVIREWPEVGGKSITRIHVTPDYDEASAAPTLRAAIDAAKGTSVLSKHIAERSEVLQTQIAEDTE